jgi:hypothetical protein
MPGAMQETEFMRPTDEETSSKASLWQNTAPNPEITTPSILSPDNRDDIARSRGIHNSFIPLSDRIRMR